MFMYIVRSSIPHLHSSMGTNVKIQILNKGLSAVRPCCRNEMILCCVESFLHYCRSLSPAMMIQIVGITRCIPRWHILRTSKEVPDRRSAPSLKAQSGPREV